MSCPASKGREVVLVGCVWPNPVLCLEAGLQDVVCAAAQCLLVLHLQLCQHGQLPWGE